MSHSKKVLMKGLVIFLLVSALGYTLYSQFILNKEAIVINANASKLSPAFSLKDLEDNEVNLKQYHGKGILINFWATYCPPCEEEMPYLESAYKEYKDKGIEILAVDVGEPKIIVNHFVGKKELSFPILLDSKGEIADLYKVQTLPTTFLVNENGEIIEKITGELSEEKIRQNVERIIP